MKVSELSQPDNELILKIPGNGIYGLINKFEKLVLFDFYQPYELHHLGSFIVFHLTHILFYTVSGSCIKHLEKDVYQGDGCERSAWQL